MAHRWTEDDNLIVIGLWLRRGADLSVDDTEVRTLARLIGTTPDSVVCALGNAEYLATSGRRGLPDYSEQMRLMWERWGHLSEEAQAEAVAVRRRMEDEARGGPVAPLTDEGRAKIEARMAARRDRRGR